MSGEALSAASVLMNSLLGALYASRLIRPRAGRTAALAVWTAVFFAALFAASLLGAGMLARSAASIALFHALGALLYRWDGALLLFAALSFTAGAEILRFVASALSSVLGSACGAVINRIAASGMFSLEGLELMISVSGFVTLLISYAFQTALLAVYLRGIARQFTLAPRGLRTAEKLFLTLPSLTVLCAAAALRLLVVSDAGGVAFYAVPATMFWVPLMCFLLLGVVATSVVLFQKMLRADEDERRRLLLEGQLARLRGEAEELQEVYADMRTLRHDLRSHLANIEALTRRDGEAARYIKKMEASIGRLELPDETGSAITDVILRRLRADAERKCAALDADFRFPSPLGIDAYDVGVILENTLANAIDACPASGTVSLRSYVKGSLFFIEVENPFDGKLLFGPDGLPMTTKPDRSAHGLGLASVRRCAQKYNGDVDVTVAEAGGRKLFQLTVMLCGRVSRPK